MVCTVRKLESGVLVLDGGTKVNDCMSIYPTYLKDFDLREGDIVNTQYGGLYAYIVVTAKKVFLKNSREAWEDKEGVRILCITNEDSVDFWEKDKSSLYRNMSSYIEFLNIVYL